VGALFFGFPSRGAWGRMRRELQISNSKENEMKRTGFWALGLAAVLTAATAGAAELKIATVDLDKVFTAHPKTQAADVELKQAEAAIEGEMEKMVAEGRALEEQVAKLREVAKSAILTDEARQKKRAEAEEKLTELQEFQVRARRTQEMKLKQLRDQVMKSRQGIVDELMVAVAAFAQDEGYDLVLDRSGMTMNMVPLVIYADPELDATDRLIARLQTAAE
jgi:outer membrane protein